MARGLSEQKFASFEEANKWIDLWMSSKDDEFLRSAYEDGSEFDDEFDGDDFDLDEIDMSGDDEEYMMEMKAEVQTSDDDEDDTEDERDDIGFDVEDDEVEVDEVENGEVENCEVEDDGDEEFIRYDN
ncbi:acidic leucine-rich nuclear phosphoprotein 32 family member B-like [Parasteatoda tepidariorum]|uniref:acidic leucine-rich nuclear phosphoprotein 32 family member B-like n=1 Tax=Parasteatoda tepidariorum TaxID=114398 RepID=UPI0039BD333B